MSIVFLYGTLERITRNNVFPLAHHREQELSALFIPCYDSFLESSFRVANSHSFRGGQESPRIIISHSRHQSSVSHDRVLFKDLSFKMFRRFGSSKYASQ